MLAHFAELVRPEVRQLSPSVLEQLQALKARQQDIMDVLELERSREHVDVVPVQRNVRSHIHFLERSIALLNEEINQTVRSSSIWHTRAWAVPPSAVRMRSYSRLRMPPASFSRPRVRR